MTDEKFKFLQTYVIIYAMFIHFESL